MSKGGRESHDVWLEVRTGLVKLIRRGKHESVWWCWRRVTGGRLAGFRNSCHLNDRGNERLGVKAPIWMVGGKVDLAVFPVEILV